ncbi:MAG TPA: hypothetical protein VIV65_01275 [Gemmatimonadaceae bacterium]|jgi:hypothetical protein
MRTHLRSLAVAAAALLIAGIAVAQDSTKKGKKADKLSDAPPKPTKPSAFWAPTTPFELTLTVNVKKVRGDKMDQAPWEWGKVSYVDSGKTVTFPVRVRTRGISRLRICNLFPPLWVDFKPADIKDHAFKGIGRLKLVTPCKPPSAFERYNLEEFNLYRLHSLVLPISHLVRPLHMTVVDSASGKQEFVRYAFAVEDADEMASRLGGKKFPVEGASANDLNTYQTAMEGLLQYMIGNTDFSIYALHNAELFQIGTEIYPIVYDYDQAGVINPPYAAVDPKLGIKSVTERIYRGMCVAPDTVKKAIADLQAKKPQIYALYTDTIGKLIGSQGAREATHWFDDVYDELKDARWVKSQILDRCRDAR